MNSNVRPFPTRKPQSDWGPRLAAAAVYFFLGYALRFPTGGSLNLLMLMGILYWAFVHQRRLNTPYLLRFHLLQAMVLYLFLTLGFLILQVAVDFLMATVGLVGMGPILGGFKLLFDGYYSLATLAVMMLSGLTLGIAALLGKTPRLPLITQNVEHWV